MDIDIKIQLQKMLIESDVFVVDTSESSRERIKKIFLGLGAIDNKVYLVSDFENYKTELEKICPKIVVSKHGLNDHTGYDVFLEYQKKYEKPEDTIFVLTTSNTSQLNISRACEAGIDVVIIKPFDNDQFIETFTSDISHIICPTEYLKTVELGKKKLFAGNLKEARGYFEDAQGMDRHPALACYYLGQANMMEQILDQAEDCYEMGVSHNEIHFKCLLALYELLKKDNRIKDSYDTLKRLFKFFPANPKRINEFVHLSIATQNYGNIESVYEIFSQIEIKTEEMKKYLSAAFITIGYVYVMNGDSKKALAAFKRVSEISESNSKFLRIIIEILTEYDLSEEIQGFYDKFHETESLDYKISSYFVSHFKESSEAGVKIGTTLLKEFNVVNPVVYKCLYNKNKQLNNVEELDDIKQAMIKNFPKRFKFK